jgi:hypothetical protein
MASKITVMNFTEQQQWVAIYDQNNNGITSGYLNAGVTTGYEIPNPEQLYNVNFTPQGASGYLTASNLAPNSQVGVSLSAGNQEEE